MILYTYIYIYITFYSINREAVDQPARDDYYYYYYYYYYDY